MPRQSALLSAMAFVLAALFCTPAPVVAAESPWVDGYNAKTRMIGGHLTRGGGAVQVVAGVEIKLASGWKTYWRAPGDSGGVPPTFDWTGSSNVASAVVLYPAPHRLRDVVGDAVGYTDGVVFPVLITPRDEKKPIDLNLAFEYGICREICVPAQAKLALTLATRGSSLSDSLRAALERVPRSAGQRRPQDPEFKGGKAILWGNAPRLVIEADFVGGTSGAEAYVEVPDSSVYLPLPKRGRSDGATNRRVFEVDLSSGVELQTLKGQTLRITLVGDAGWSEAAWKID